MRAHSQHRLFFDGTDNNHGFHPPQFNTNISKLSRAYKDIPADGYFNYYVSGVGTPFNEIKRTEVEIGGGSAGAGGEARIIYGLLQVINSVHRSINSAARLGPPELAALCSSASAPAASPGIGYAPPPELAILRKLGLSQGLLYESARQSVFSKVSSELRSQVTARDKRPRIVAIYLDVFGFSRGAASARVFVSWLHRYLLLGKELFGVPAYVRMLGLFDTVASVGLTNAAGSAGHNFWAKEQDLRIHPEVKNCLHHVALHELRTNFPLDSVAVGEQLPPNCQEHHCPGAHSDVGGGYAAGDQGKGIRKERFDPRDVESHMRPVPDAKDRLSNLTLVHMYDAAVLACRRHVNIPWIAVHAPQERRPGGLAEVFGLDGIELIKKQVARYFTDKNGIPIEQTPNTRQALRLHSLRYLTWRYQLTEGKRYRALPSMDAAESLDLQSFKYNLQGQQIFESQMEDLKYHARWATASPYSHPRAVEIYKSMRDGAAGFRPDWGSFFDRYVHDSFAGFIGHFHGKGEWWVTSVAMDATHKTAERQGYVRWRQLYQGGSEGLNAQAPNDSEFAQRSRSA